MYVDLLRHPGSTGYRIGRSLGKPHANVYQALVALEQKGAVLFEEGEPRTYHAVPPTELIGNLRLRYEQGCAAAEKALNSVQPSALDADRVFRLTTSDQVLGRAVAMLDGATEAVIMSAHPAFIDKLRVDLERTAKRGVSIAGTVLRQEDIVAGTNLVVAEVAGRIAQVWPDDQLYIVVDALELLLASIDREGRVQKAVWVNSPFLATVLHNALVANTILHTLPEAKEMQTFNMHLFGFHPPGVRAFLNDEAKKPTPRKQQRLRSKRVTGASS